VPSWLLLSLDRLYPTTESVQQAGSTTLYTTYQATILARSNIRITWDVLMRLELKQQGLSEAEINERRAIQQKYHTKTAMEHLGRYNNAHNVPWYDALLTAIGNDTP
jgi:hypothetical protein